MRWRCGPSSLARCLLVVLPQQPLASIGRKQRICTKAKEHDALLELFCITKYYRGEHVPNFASLEEQTFFHVGHCRYCVFLRVVNLAKLILKK